MGCIKKILSSPILKPVADMVAVATGNPELIPLINGGLTAGSNLANGQSIGKSIGQGLISGGTSFAGNELAGAAANYFPETAASLGYTDTGGNSLTDLLGNTSGAGSLTGAGTIGGDLSGIASGGASGNSTMLSRLLSGSGASPAGGVDSAGVDMASPSSVGAAAINSSGLPGSSQAVGGSNIGSAFNISPGGGGSSYSSGSPGTTGGGSSYGGMNLAAALLGGANSLNANDQAQKALLASQKNSMTVLQPYLNSGTGANTKLSDALGTSGNTGAAGYGDLTQPFTPGDLTQDPGYQFNLQQGTQAIDRKNAASGDYFSGTALKDAQQFGQGLADNTYNAAYQRDAAQKGQKYGMLAGQAGAGQGAAGAAGTIFSNTGNAQANAGISSSNILNSTLSSLLTGNGAKRPVNIGGQVFYA